ncbi:SDR family oxidoreductase [Methylobacterium dankookense]|uniref:NAD(P)-binding domain-containing protein n=1 Tax=Methylobacterium dankookense TaxID=560405 RepID=A0ABQ4RL15_9HYPH|nr:NAD(P)H-binding protein [Methylobacterium dankookense]GJD57899.1 hypothetical protein IFDJLNFL_3812 [Methylobacterium dankookense]
MRIVIIGGSGLIGSRLAARLAEAGHSVLPASPRTGVDAVTGQGLAAALAGAEVVVDVANAPSFADGPVLDFFTRSTRNLLAAGAEAGLRHHVALSVVGTDRLQASGYFRAKLAQERLIAEGPLPYTIVRATQFFEFLGGIADAGTAAGTVRVAPTGIQPIAAADVAALLAGIAVAAPARALSAEADTGSAKESASKQGLGAAPDGSAIGSGSKGIVEIAGPEAFRLDALLARILAGDGRTVLADPEAGYFGTPVTGDPLLPGPDARLAPTRLADWLPARTA